MIVAGSDTERPEQPQIVWLTCCDFRPLGSLDAV